MTGRAHVGLVVALCAAAACGSSSERACTPGQSTACACVDGTFGAQVCNAAGSAYGACLCGDGPGPGGANGQAGSGMGAAAGAPGGSGGAGGSVAPGQGGAGTGAAGGAPGAGGHPSGGGAGGTPVGGSSGQAGHPGLRAACGNGIVEAGEACDRGAANGLTYGDGSGCSMACTAEPSCLDATGTTRACDTVCGDGNKEGAEQCDDGNTTPGDGCSATCQIESGFHCAHGASPYPRCTSAPNAPCLRMAVTYRDFLDETKPGGHPDFVFLGGVSAVPPTAGQLRACISDAAGSHNQVGSTDAVDRTWGIAGDTLVKGKPQYGPGTDTPFLSPCKFTDWSAINTAHFPTPYDFATDSPLRNVPTALASNPPSWSSGAPGIPMVTGKTSFDQWFNDSSLSVRSRSSIQLDQSSQGLFGYRFGVSPDRLSGGFFPLDVVDGVPSSTLLCDLWPIWYPFPGCVGDYYVTNLTLTQTVVPGWIAGATGRLHDYYFTMEARALVPFNDPFTIKLSSDDDAWLFINGTLVLDLGGIHDILPGSVFIDLDGNANIVEGGATNARNDVVTSYTDANGQLVTLAQPGDYRMRVVNLGLQRGHTYEVALFHAERSPTDSLLGMEINDSYQLMSDCYADLTP